MRIAGPTIVLCALAYTAARCVTPPAPSVSNDQILVSVAGTPEIVYRWEKQRCETWTIPDAPARAFVDANRMVRLFAAASSNWSLTGNSLDSLLPDCKSSFRGSRSPSPFNFDDEAWIEGTYTIDGKNVIALLSNEWRSDAKRERSQAPDGAVCANDRNAVCHYYSINIALSTNGGATFSYTPGSHVLATEPIENLDSAHPVIGAATSSNIFQFGKYEYTLIGVRTARAYLNGSCLFRTLAGSRPTDWQFWDGHSYLRAPMLSGPQSVDPAESTPCVPVHVPFPEPVWFRSISFLRDCRCYMGTFQGSQFLSKGIRQTGFYFTSSIDLLNWSTPEMIMSVPFDSECLPSLVYPSILDPLTTSENFGDIGLRPYLYYTRINRHGCHGTADRDLLRVQLKIGIREIH